MPGGTPTGTRSLPSPIPNQPSSEPMQCMLSQRGWAVHKDACVEEVPPPPASSKAAESSSFSFLGLHVCCMARNERGWVGDGEGQASSPATNASHREQKEVFVLLFYFWEAELGGDGRDGFLPSSTSHKRRVHGKPLMLIYIMSYRRLEEGFMLLWGVPPIFIACSPRKKPPRERGREGRVTGR